MIVRIPNKNYLVKFISLIARGIKEFLYRFVGEYLVRYRLPDGIKSNSRCKACDVSFKILFDFLIVRESQKQDKLRCFCPIRPWADGRNPPPLLGFYNTYIFLKGIHWSVKKSMLAVFQVSPSQSYCPWKVTRCTKIGQALTKFESR